MGGGDTGARPPEHDAVLGTDSSNSLRFASHYWLGLAMPFGDTDQIAVVVGAVPRQVRAIALERNELEALLFDMRSAPGKKHGELLDK